MTSVEWLSSGVGTAAAMLVGVLVGGFIPFQTAINTRLSMRLGAVLPASLVSFVVGTAALALAVVVTGTSVPWAATAAEQPWWIWTGGVCGLIYLSMNIVLMPRIGAAATVILPMVGLVLGGLVINVTGAFGSPSRAFSVPVALGAVAVVAGAVMVNLAGRPGPAVGGRVASPEADHASAPVALWVAAVLAGSLGAVQTAVNGRLGEVMGSGLAATLVSFLVGAVGLAVLCLVTRQRWHVAGALRPWMFSGGVLGASFVFVNAVNATVLGTALTVSVALLGQIAAGLALDHFGWIGARTRPVTAARVAGALTVLVGVTLVRFG